MSSYWDGRKFKNSKFSHLKSNKLVQALQSVRISDEAFLIDQLEMLQPKSVLDIACGAGKHVLQQYVPQIYGVDITGYPKQIAEEKKYTTIEYSPPDYEINLDEKVDLLLCISLNAHIPFEAFETILKEGLRKLNSNSHIIIIGEFDNDSPSYKLFKRNPDKFRTFVNNMQHMYLEKESDFCTKLDKTFPNLVLKTREPLITIPSITHFYAYYANKDFTSSFGKAFARLTDVPVSLANSLSCQFDNVDRTFLVGFVYQVI